MNESVEPGAALTLTTYSAHILFAMPFFLVRGSGLYDSSPTYNKLYYEGPRIDSLIRIQRCGFPMGFQTCPSGIDFPQLALIDATMLLSFPSVHPNHNSNNGLHKENLWNPIRMAAVPVAGRRAYFKKTRQEHVVIHASQDVSTCSY